MNSKKAKGYMDCGMLDSMLSTLITKDQSLREIAQFFYHQGYMDCHAKEKVKYKRIRDRDIDSGYENYKANGECNL